jgi:UDP-glucose/iron transport system ATP-binding protein
MARLSCRGLTRAPWFRGRDLALDAGEIAVLVGANGTGKTLFLRAIADLDPVDEGTCELDGTPREDLAPAEWRRRVVYVHQRNPSTGPTVGADLARIGALVAQAGRTLSPPPGLDACRPTATLSGGEAQRLALERALAISPEVLLLDETTSQLDGQRAREAERRVREWADGGGCVVWVSHDAGLAARVGGRIERFP